MDLSQTKALKKDVTNTLLSLTATTYKDGKEHSNWIDFLKSNMFTYKYPFSEQLQIHTQTKDGDIKPRAIADLEIWNKFGYKLKDSEAKAISISALDNANTKTSQKQLYDISQLERKDGRDEEIPFKLWDKGITLDTADRLKTAMMEKYDIEPIDDKEISLNNVLFLCLEKNLQGILDENGNKFGVGENMSERTYEEIGFTAFVSAQIMIIARLGSKAGFTNENATSFYKMMYDHLPRINTKETITVLGEMTNTFAREMFAEIEIEVKKIERELKTASKGELKHEQIRLDGMGKNATGISEGIQPEGVSEVVGTGAVDSPLHGDTEPNAGIHREDEKSNIGVSNRNGANAGQSSEPDRMDAGDKLHSADGEGNSNQGDNRGHLVDEKEESIFDTSINKKVLITNISDYDPNIYGKPWVCVRGRRKNYFTTKDGEPIGEYTGNTDSGEGGGIYVINPQEGRIYGHGLKNKQDNTKSLIAYVKYQDGIFYPCDRKGKLLAVDIGIDKSVEPERAEVKESTPNTKITYTQEEIEAVTKNIDPNLRAALMDSKFFTDSARAYVAGLLSRSKPMHADPYFMREMTNYHQAHNNFTLPDGKQGTYCIDNRGVFISSEVKEDFQLKQWASHHTLPGVKLFSWEKVAETLHTLYKYQIENFEAWSNAKNSVAQLDTAETPEDVTESLIPADKTLETTEQTQTQSPIKSEWETFIKERSTGVYAQQYTEPVVIIEFSENPNFGGENSLDSQDYEVLSFAQADRKFKDVEIEVRADQIKRNGKLGGYDKTYGVILYKDDPEDMKLSTYEFRYGIGDYSEEESGIYNHIKSFWDYQEKAIQKGELTVYRQENVDNVKRMLSILEPYAVQAIPKEQNNDMKDYTSQDNETEYTANKQSINEVLEPQEIQVPKSVKEINTDIKSSEIYVRLNNSENKSDTKGKYSDTHFRIGKNGYEHSNGWVNCDEATRMAYKNEVAKIFADNGWSIEESDGNSSVYLARKGRSQLYLHPQDFSGACENSEREALLNALGKANTFVCRAVDVYEEIHDMTDEQLADKLNSEREEIENELLEALTTKRSNLYITNVGQYGVGGNIGKRHSLKRLVLEGEKNFTGVDKRTEGICATFVADILKSFVDSGKIVSAKTKNGIGYRSSNKDEIRQSEVKQVQLWDLPPDKQEQEQEQGPENESKNILETTVQDPPLLDEAVTNSKQHGFLENDKPEIEETVKETNNHISNPAPKNYRLNEQILNRTTFSEKTRYKDNIGAIKTLKLLEAENRTATKDEQETLSKYVGWGGISQAFNSGNPSWSSEHAELKKLLTDQEYREAQASTLSAFYTNPIVIKAMYEALENTGITTQINENEKLNILEPSLGVGNFFGVMPDEIRQKSNLHGVELDSISARIAQNLYPGANIQNTGYEETYAKDYFDVILGNVPFGDFKLIDKQNPEISQHGFRIHDHFFGKALDQVRPGGVVAFITSSGTMDKETTKTRRYIAERAELLGAIRLPNNAFKGIANTEVTSDIIFLRRRTEPLNLSKIKEQAERDGKDGEESIKQLCPWVFTEKVSGINKINGEDVPINSYFINNPQMVLGEMMVDSGNRMHGAIIPTCKPFEGMDLSEQLEEAVKRLKTDEPIQPQTKDYKGYIGTFESYNGLDPIDQEQSQEPIISKIPRNFSYVLGNENSVGKGKIYFFEILGKPLEDVTDTLSDLQKERMAGLIGIKDTCRALIDAQLSNNSSETIKGLQGELNTKYDEYTKKHGLINGRTAKQLFIEDSSYPLLCALEVLDTNGEFIRKSDMFSKRTINPIIEITSADTAEEALILSMSERGFVDVSYMEKLTGKTENELFSELIGLGKVYKDLRYPFGIGSYEYCTLDEYLSGNVRVKLSKAETLLSELKELRTRFEDKDYNTKDKQIRYLAKLFDLDEKLLRELMATQVTERDINKFGRFEELISTVDKHKAKIFFDKAEGVDIQLFRVNMKVDNLLREFVLKGVLDIKEEDIGIDIDDKYNLDTEGGAEKYAEICANIETVKRNISALEKSIPKKLESSDIDVRFGSTWIPPRYIGDFIGEKLQLSKYATEGLGVVYNKYTSTWGKNSTRTHVDRVLSKEVYGTTRIDAMDIMFDTLNLRDVKVYDPHPDDSKRKVLNYKETVLAQNVQKKIKKEFIDWIWDNPDRRADLVEIYNRQFNAIRPREYDGSNLRFPGMSPGEKLKPHQKDAVARILYGGNTLLAHEVGLGKTYEMIAAAMESKRLGLCNKSLVVVPKHLTEQFGADFLKLYPNANVLIVSENDFTPQNRKKFCSKIATGDYDAIVMAHSQFEKVPLSRERQEKFIQDQLDELEYENDAVKNDKDSKQFTIKQLEKRKKQLEAKLDELVNQEYKDDTIAFEELGIGKLFVDEAHFFKNLYFTTKLTNVAGLSKSESNRATDMFMKCRYLDEKTGNKGVTFATGTPISNSLAEMFVRP